MRICPRCYTPVRFGDGFGGLAANCNHCDERLRGNGTAVVAGIVALGAVASPPLTMRLLGGPLESGPALWLTAGHMLAVFLSLSVGWCAGRFVSRRVAGWPTARREISRRFLRLASRRTDYQKLSAGERVLWNVCRFMGCFENRGLCGGLHEYFWNAPGDHALATVQALEAIGARNTAAFLRQACLFFPEGAPATDQATRRDQMEQTSDPFKEDPMMEWASAHPEYQNTNFRLFSGIGDHVYGLLWKFCIEQTSSATCPLESRG